MSARPDPAPAPFGCPVCPTCRLPVGCPGPRRLDLVCGACGLLWLGTAAEYDMAKRAQDAYDAGEAALREHVAREAEADRDRARARALFVEAGKPIPGWLR